VTAVPPRVSPIVVTASLPVGGSLTPVVARGTAALASVRATSTALAAAALPGGSGPGTQSVGPDGGDGRRTGIILLGVALLALVGLGGLGYVFWRWSRPAPSAPGASTVLIGPPPPPPVKPEPQVWEEHDWRRPGSPSE
jgi:hypothetical protein